MTAIPDMQFAQDWNAYIAHGNVTILKCRPAEVQAGIKAYCDNFPHVSPWLLIPPAYKDVPPILEPHRAALGGNINIFVYDPDHPIAKAARDAVHEDVDVIITRPLEQTPKRRRIVR